MRGLPFIIVNDDLAQLGFQVQNIDAIALNAVRLPFAGFCVQRAVRAIE